MQGRREGKGLSRAEKPSRDINYINYINYRLEMTWGRSQGWEELQVDTPQDGNAEQKWKRKVKSKPDTNRTSPGCSPTAWVQRWGFTPINSTRDTPGSDTGYRMELHWIQTLNNQLDWPGEVFIQNPTSYM